MSVGNDLGQEQPFIHHGDSDLAAGSKVSGGDHMAATTYVNSFVTYQW